MNPLKQNEQPVAEEEANTTSSDESAELAIGKLEAPQGDPDETAAAVAPKKRGRVSISLKLGLAATILITVAGVSCYPSVLRRFT